MQKCNYAYKVMFVDLQLIKSNTLMLIWKHWTK